MTHHNPEEQHSGYTKADVAATKLYDLLAGLKSGAYTIKEAYDGILKLGDKCEVVPHHSEVEGLVEAAFKTLQEIDVDVEENGLEPAIARAAAKDAIRTALTTHSAKVREAERERITKMLKEAFPYDENLVKAYTYPKTYKGGFDAAWYLGRKQLYDLIATFTTQTDVTKN